MVVHCVQSLRTWSRLVFHENVPFPLRIPESWSCYENAWTLYRPLATLVQLRMHNLATSFWRPVAPECQAPVLAPVVVFSDVQLGRFLYEKNNVFLKKPSREKYAMELLDSTF